MKHLKASLFCLATLTACAPHYGNYAKLSDAYNAQMADDGVHELVALYPPASTHLAIAQTTLDAYGAELVKKLRESGYAMEDGSAPSPSTAVPAVGTSDIIHNHPKPTDTPASAPAKATTGRTLGYIVDSLTVGLYRVTLSIDAKIISRVYRTSGTDIAPAGAWTRKE